MKEVSKMNDQQLNRALAELMGYYLHETPGSHYLLMYPEQVSASGICDDEETAWKQAPQYCTDPAASLEVQAAARKKDPVQYIKNLAVVVWTDTLDPEDVVDWVAIDMEYVAELCDATPRQRAGAAYMTLRGEGT